MSIDCRHYMKAVLSKFVHLIMLTLFPTVAKPTSFDMSLG